MIDSLKRGVAAGGVAGLAYGLFIRLVLDPLFHHLEELARHEHAGEAGAHAHEGDHLVSEATAVAASVGGGVLWGVLLGAAFGAAYFLLEPALPGGRGKPYLLAGAGFLTVSGAPWAVLPPTTPGMEHLLGSELRLALYGGLMLLGAGVGAASLVAYGRVTASRGRPAGLVAAAVPLAGLAAVLTLTSAPYAGTAPSGEIVTVYRVLVAGGQVGLWSLVAAAYVRFDGVFGDATSPAATQPAD